MIKSSVLALTLALTLIGCIDKQSPIPPGDILGAYSATGTIVSTGSSLYRRGTHVLKMDGRSRFYLESKDVNLNQYVGEYIVVQGEVVPNSHERFLPVFQVESVFQVEEPSRPDLQSYRASELRLSLEAPREWVSSVARGKLTFRLAEEPAPFVHIEQNESEFLPEGLPVRIGSRNGVRLVDPSTPAAGQRDEANQHHVFVQQNEKTVITFLFIPQGEESALLRDAFYTMLRSVRFEEEEKKEEEESEEEEKQQGSGIPCGGPAGVLCPAGEYCDVKEFDTGIGTCTRL